MATESEGKGAENAAERAIAQKRDELLAEARRRVEGEGDQGAASGSRMMGLGLQFVVSILLCLYLGQWLDRKLGTAPWLLLLGVFAGAGFGFWSMYRVMTDENRRSDEERKRK
jgi:ATP synthase protein I